MTLYTAVMHWNPLGRKKALIFQLWLLRCVEFFGGIKSVSVKVCLHIWGSVHVSMLGYSVRFYRSKRTTNYL